MPVHKVLRVMIKKIFFIVVFICLCGLIGCVLSGCKQTVIEVNYENASSRALKEAQENAQKEKRGDNGIIFLGETNSANPSIKMNFGPSDLKFDID